MDEHSHNDTVFTSKVLPDSSIDVITSECAKSMSATELIQRISNKPLELQTVPEIVKISPEKCELEGTKKEIEIKVTIADVHLLQQFLEKEGKFMSATQEQDEYFSPADPGRDFLNNKPIREWLRLRNAGERQSIDYKNWRYDADGRSNYCDEFKARVDDQALIHSELLANGFRTIVIVEKTRKTWHCEQYLISIDEVKNLGNFIEIEYDGDDPEVDPAQEANNMIALLERIGCTQIERNYVGYPFMVLFPERAQQEKK